MTRTGLILAGGSSSRFGEPKSLVPFDGRPMVQWVADTLRSRCDEILLSIRAADAVRAFQEAVPGAHLVRDAVADRGPIEGLGRGLAAAQGEVVLVAPCDAPLLRPSLYDALLALLGDHEAAVPWHQAMDPVRAVYRREAALQALGGAGIGSPSALVDRLDAVFLEGEALRAADSALVSFVDVNRKEDLEPAERLARPGVAVAAGRRRY